MGFSSLICLNAKCVLLSNPLYGDCARVLLIMAKRKLSFFVMLDEEQKIDRAITLIIIADETCLTVVNFVVLMNSIIKMLLRFISHISSYVNQQTNINYFIMNDPIAKRSLIKIILIISVVYLVMQIVICFADDRHLSMSFWLEHHNAKMLIDAGLPEKSVYIPAIQAISDYHFWIFRAVLIILLVSAIYYKKRNQELYGLFLNILISSVIILLLNSFAITWILKILTGKPRPDTLLELYSPFSLSARYHSFPSGHTTETFSYIIPYVYFIRKYYANIILVLFGVLISSARIILAHHFFTDVLFGIYISVISGLIICYMIEHREQKAKKIVEKGLD
jgi:membrane-associated phospholipid phosphatase